MPIDLDIRDHEVWGPMTVLRRLIEKRFGPQAGWAAENWRRCRCPSGPGGSAQTGREAAYFSGFRSPEIGRGSAPASDPVRR